MRSIFAAVLVACLAVTVHAGDDENPFKKAKVGDWTEYKMTGPNLEGTTKMTIVSKDDKEVVYEVTSTYTVMGKSMKAPGQKQKIDLTKSYDPVSAVNLKAKSTKIEKDGEGNEKIKVGDNEYDTKWTKMKSTSTVGKLSVVSEYKVWFSTEVPLSGLVKMETTTSTITTKLELIGSGRK